MIIPWLRGFLAFDKVPLTWIIIGLNVFIYLIIWDSDRDDRNYFATQREIAVLGKMYQQFKSPQEYRAQALELNQYTDLGNRAIRDPDFLARYKKTEWLGDEIEIQKAKAELDQYLRSVNERWSSHLGLNNFSNHWTQWLSYQFMHASWIHVFGNMVMLLIFGSALESMIGSFLFALMYLLAGAIGGLAFVGLNGVSVVPMVGASASLSGVIAFYIIYEVKKRVSFFYFISPFPGYYGRIHLPTVLLFPLIFLQDLVGYLNADPRITGGVAYTAHIGGAVAGIGLALFAKQMKKNSYYQWLVSISRSP